MKKVKPVDALVYVAAAVTFATAVWFDFFRHELPSPRRVAAMTEFRNAIDELIIDSRSMTDDEMMYRARAFARGRSPEYLTEVSDELMATNERRPGRMGVYILEAGAELGYGGLGWRAASRYMQGSFVDKDIDRARQLFDHPAVLVDRWAKYRLALILLDAGEAERGETLMREAANAGVPPAERWVIRRSAGANQAPSQ